MDYVVAGFGIGAILALIGFALWELYGNREEPGQGWLSRAAIGAMLGSLVIWAVTGVTLVSTLDDSTASRLVMLTTLITVVAILAGTFWYWRADQALLASMPKRTAQQPQEQFAAVATPRETNIELSEWDSWPERGEGSADTPEPIGVPDIETDFAPEVAAEPASDAEVRTEPRTPMAEQDSVDEDAAPVEDIVLDVAVEAPPAPEVVEPAVPAAAGIAEPVVAGAEVDTLPPPEEPAATVETAAVLMALPANVRPLRPKQALAGRVPAKTESAAAAAPLAPIADSVPEEREAPTGSGQLSKAAAGQNGAKAPIEPPAPAAFESSILADIDGTAVEGNGRYQSPLLADLETNPDELEGVGLAKWPADARLTAEDLEEPRTPKGRRKR